MGCFIQNETAVRPWSCEVILGPDSADDEDEEECDSPPRYEDPEKVTAMLILPLLFDFKFLIQRINTFPFKKCTILI